MNTKKADWINQPLIEKKTLHSLSVKADGKHTILFVVGENDEVALSIRTELPYGFLLLHTPEEYVLVKKDEAEIAFGDIRSTIPLPEQSDELRFRKEGKRISMISKDKTILTIEKDAFLTSSAFGITIAGKGDAYIEVF